MSNAQVRAWSATTRSRTSVDVVGAVLRAGELDGAVEDVAGGVDLVEVLDALQDRGHPLEAHAGVDVLRGQRRRGSGSRPCRVPPAALVLHEHEVPDLEVAVLVGDRAAFGAVLRAAVVVDLRARAARGRGRPSTSSCRPCRGAGCARRARRRCRARCSSLVVVEVDRDPEPVLGRSRSRRRRPASVSSSQANGIAPLLEVVAEARSCRTSGRTSACRVVLPTSSMSRVRTHFCTLVARAYGGGRPRRGSTA